MSARNTSTFGQLDNKPVIEDADIFAMESGASGQLFNITAEEIATYVGSGSSVTGHVIQDEGDVLTQRNNLNFVGGGVLVIDDPTNDATLVTIGSVSNWSNFPAISTVDIDNNDIIKVDRLLFDIDTAGLDNPNDTGFVRSSFGMQLNIPSEKGYFFRVNDTNLMKVRQIAGTNNTELELTSVISGAKPVLKIMNNDTTITAPAELSRFDFIGRNDASQTVTFASIKTSVEDKSDNLEDGMLDFNVMLDGSETTFLSLNGSGNGHIVALVDIDMNNNNIINLGVESFVLSNFGDIPTASTNAFIMFVDEPSVSGDEMLFNVPSNTEFLFNIAGSRHMSISNTSTDFHSKNISGIHVLTMTGVGASGSAFHLDQANPVDNNVVGEILGFAGGGAPNPITKIEFISKKATIPRQGEMIFTVASDDLPAITLSLIGTAVEGVSIIDFHSRDMTNIGKMTVSGYTGSAVPGTHILELNVDQRISWGETTGAQANSIVGSDDQIGMFIDVDLEYEFTTTEFISHQGITINESDPTFLFKAFDATPINLLAGQIMFENNNSEAATSLYGQFFVKVIDPTAGSEDAEMDFRIRQDGTLKTFLIFNPSGNDVILIGANIDMAGNDLQNIGIASFTFIASGEIPDRSTNTFIMYTNEPIDTGNEVLFNAQAGTAFLFQHEGIGAMSIVPGGGGVGFFEGPLSRIQSISLSHPTLTPHITFRNKQALSTGILGSITTTNDTVASDLTSIDFVVEGIGIDDEQGRIDFKVAADSNLVDMISLVGGAVVADSLIDFHGRTINNIATMDFVAGGGLFGSTPAQKIGFWGATPVIQPALIADPTNTATTQTAVIAILAQLQSTGLQASS